MSKEMVDAVFDFFRLAGTKHNVVVSPSRIRVAGGETLIDDDSVALIDYIANKWQDAMSIFFGT